MNVGILVLLNCIEYNKKKNTDKVTEQYSKEFTEKLSLWIWMEMVEG